MIRPPRFLQSMNLEISWDKYCVSKKYVSYCQAFGYAPRFNRSIHRDTIKVRLLNEFRKQGGHDSFEEPDPLVGKARDLERSVRHIGSKDYKDFIEAVIPLALRAGMPRWFETKIFKNPQSYMPSAFGGLGIPSTVHWWESEKCCKIYKTYCLDHCPGLLTKKVQDKSWHRGQEFHEQVVHLGTLMEGKTFREAWIETQERIDQGSNTASGSRRVQREIFREYVRVDEPLSLIGTKESTAPAVFNGRSELAVVKPDRRSRQILQQKARLFHNNRELVDSIPYNQVDMEELHTKRPGLWIQRKVLQENLRISFSVPRMVIPSRFFDGQVGNYVTDVEQLYYNCEFPDNVDVEFEFDPGIDFPFS